MVLSDYTSGCIDPFAGHGISLDLHSGELAARSIIGFFQGKYSLEQAHQQYHASYSKHLAPAFRNAARVRKLLSAPSFILSTLLSLAGTKPFAKMLVRKTRVR